MAATAVSGILQGTTDVSVVFELRNTSDNLETLAKVAANMTIRYWRPIGSVTTITPNDLAAVTTAHNDGGVKELDSTNMKGQYRLDLPDAATASGAPFVLVTITVSGCWVSTVLILLSPAELPWTFSTTLMNTLTDHILKRDWVGITGEASRSLLNAARFLRNRWRIPPSSTTLTVYKEDDSTTAWTSTVEPSGTASSVIGSDPA